jgi:hypothetical protein
MTSNLHARRDSAIATEKTEVSALQTNPEVQFSKSLSRSSVDLCKRGYKASSAARRSLA